MSLIHFLPDDRFVESEAGETILQTSLRAGIPHTNECGGRARCSTCRVIVQDGLAACSPRSEAEQAMAERLGFCAELRLACQTVPAGAITVRRLVLDDDDIELVDQRKRPPADFSIGEERQLAILFSDIRGFTSFSETLPPYDVIHILNRYFHAMGKVVDEFGGTIDNYMGDGLMALFGLTDGARSSAWRAVSAGLRMIETMQALKPYLQMAYGRDFDIGVGIHYGEAVVGSVGARNHQRVTAIGDSVNLASRIESANKVVGSRLLISEATYAELRDQVQIGRVQRLPIAGKLGEYTLYEVVGIG